MIIISLHRYFIFAERREFEEVRLAPIGSCATDLADLQELTVTPCATLLPKNEREGRDSAVTLYTEDGLT